MKENPLKAGIRGLTLAALISGCATATPEPQPANTPAFAPTATPHVRFEPTATPTPPSLRVKGIMFPTSDVHEISQELTTLYDYLLYPTFAAIGTQSFKEYMDSRGCQFSVTETRFPEIGIVLDPNGALTKKLPTEAAETLIDENTLRQATKIPLRFLVKVWKKGDKEEFRWVARFAKVKIGDNPPVETWVFNRIDGHTIAVINKR